MGSLEKVFVSSLMDILQSVLFEVNQAARLYSKQCSQVDRQAIRLFHLILFAVLSSRYYIHCFLRDNNFKFLAKQK